VIAGLSFIPISPPQNVILTNLKPTPKPQITITTSQAPQNMVEKLKVNPTRTIAQLPTDPPQPTPVVGCVVTIEGRRFDVLALRQTHSGGDIFTCGTDMTATYFSKHDASMLNGVMQQYLIQ